MHIKQKPRVLAERGLVATSVNLAKALFVIVHHLAPQAVLDREHLTNRNDLAALLADVLGGLVHGPGMLFGLLTGLSHFSYSFAALVLN